MKIVTGEKMGQIDREAMEGFGIPGMVLMENAGLQVVNLLQELLPPGERGAVVVVCGKGNNGGDGFVIARHLSRLGYRVKVLAVDRPETYKGDAAQNYRILLDSGTGVMLTEDRGLRGLGERLDEGDVIVDALLGTGTRRRVSEQYQTIIDDINRSRARVVAVDIPSGISADTGEVMGTAVRADYTVTFALPKRGLLLFPGAEHAGRVAVADIGIPEELLTSTAIRENLVDAEYVAERLPPRKPDGHKGTYGRVLIVAGSPGMTGAAALTGEAALRGGAGLVYAGTTEELRPVLEAKLKEVISLGFPGDKKGDFKEGAAREVLEKARTCQAVAFGPGLNPSAPTLELLKELLRSLDIPLVVDAGSLAALALEPGALRHKKAPVVLTPHPGEMARLLGTTVSAVQEERWELAARQAAEWGTVVLLKGAHTVIAAPGGEVYVSPSGNPALSTAGTGDLLTGLVAALAAQGLSPLQAAACGAFLHGLSADLLVRERGARGWKAGDVLDFIPAALNSLAAPPQRREEFLRSSLRWIREFEAWRW